MTARLFIGVPIKSIIIEFKFRISLYAAFNRAFILMIFVID